ncbi:MAG TPA: hypothetical protein VNS46_07780 [Nocardioides sp.]|nr:hypothetical protein [Nocardioides sp.]
MASYEPPAEYPVYPDPGQLGYGTPGYGPPPLEPWHAAAQLGLPEGVVLAPQGRRVGAFFLTIPLVLVTLGIGYLVWGAIVWGRGTSPALQVLGMRAWKPERRWVAGWGDMAARNGLDWLVAMATCNISRPVSFVMFLTDQPLHRTLADRIGDTVIVHDPHGRLG